MSRLTALAALSLFLAPLPGFAGQESEEAPPVAEATEVQPEVKPELFFDVEQFAPGKRASLVIVLNVPEQWHIYWDHPGEAGMATTIEVTGPEGWQIEAVRYPGPTPYVDAQGNACTILEGEAGFFVPILPPDDAKPGSEVEFRVRATWLLCKESCQLGKLDQTISVQVTDSLPRRVSDRRLAGMRNRLPRIGPGSKVVGYSFAGDLDEANLTFMLPRSAELRFFPYSDSAMVVAQEAEGSRAAELSQRNYVLRQSPSADVEAIGVHGVLRVQEESRVQYFEINLTGAQFREPVVENLGHGDLPVVPRKKE
ncbi:MAG: protein-disulfide reductase DsbD family protein [Planctomycetota bacterium]